MKKILLFIAVLMVGTSQAQGVLVKDIQTGSTSSMPNYEFNRVDANGKLFFSVLYGSKYAVWVTDGTASGTKVIRNLVSPSIVPQYFTYLQANDKVFFSGESNSSAISQIWTSDGTLAGTNRLTTAATRAKFITEFNNRVYYQGFGNSNQGFELFYTDASLNTQILNVNSSQFQHSYPADLKTIGNLLYFSADANKGREPYTSSGGNAPLLMDINVGAGDSNPRNFTSFNNKVYFSADDGVNGRELWVTDGTAANTTMVADLNPGANPSLDTNEPTIFTEYKDELYFTAYTPATGNELFKVNTSGNIVNVADINPGGSNHSNPKGFFVFDNKLFFSADNGTDGVELWYTQNTGGSTSKTAAITTAIFKNINTQANGNSKPTDFIEFDGKMYFTADDGINGKELWESDGTVAGTILKQDINPTGESNPRDFIVSNNLLYFSADDGINGDELWKFSNDFLIGSLSPEDNSENIAISGEKLKITLNRNLQKGTGNIIIYKSSDDSVFETINVSNSNVTITNNEVTIDPTLNFSASEDYYVFITNGAFKDASNNLFTGISDKSIWNFKTAGVQNQTITFDILADKTFGDANFQLTATASSNLAISYTSSNTNVATINGNTVTIVGAGNTTITASQAGNAGYNAATNVTQTLTVNKRNQTISYTSTPDKTFGGADFQLNATVNSNLPISFTSSNTNALTINGNIATIVGAGTTIITASQAGNANYNATTKEAQVLVVREASQTITFVLNFTNNRLYADADRTLNASSDSGLPVTYTSSDPNVIAVNGNVVSFVGVGNGIVITAKQIGNNNYKAALDVTQTINVSKAGQIITFNPPTNVTYGDPNFTLSATSNSGIPVSFLSWG